MNEEAPPDVTWQQVLPLLQGLDFELRNTLVDVIGLAELIQEKADPNVAKEVAVLRLCADRALRAQAILNRLTRDPVGTLKAMKAN
jgi:hypothetical protein